MSVIRHYWTGFDNQLLHDVQFFWVWMFWKVSAWAVIFSLVLRGCAHLWHNFLILLFLMSSKIYIIIVILNYLLSSILVNPLWRNVLLHIQATSSKHVDIWNFTTLDQMLSFNELFIFQKIKQTMPKRTEVSKPQIGPLNSRQSVYVLKFPT